nr:MAG TPA: hypothetical protein [Caudoviricetes sp.]
MLRILNSSIVPLKIALGTTFLSFVILERTLTITFLPYYYFTRYYTIKLYFYLLHLLYNFVI